MTTLKYIALLFIGYTCTQLYMMFQILAAKFAG